MATASNYLCSSADYNNSVLRMKPRNVPAYRSSLRIPSIIIVSFECVCIESLIGTSLLHSEQYTLYNIQCTLHTPYNRFTFLPGHVWIAVALRWKMIRPTYLKHGALVHASSWQRMNELKLYTHLWLSLQINNAWNCCCWSVSRVSSAGWWSYNQQIPRLYSISWQTL